MRHTCPYSFYSIKLFDIIFVMCHKSRLHEFGVEEPGKKVTQRYALVRAPVDGWRAGCGSTVAQDAKRIMLPTVRRVSDPSRGAAPVPATRLRRHLTQVPR